MAQPYWTREEGPEADVTIEENWLFRLRRERFRSRRTGGTHDFYVMQLADAVNVIALTPDRSVILVQQFRAGSGKDSLETPGGLIEPGEDPLEAGARELLEETGYAGDPAISLGTTYSNPSIMTSKITTILITNARKVAEPNLDPGEDVVVVGRYATLIPRAIARGEIDHALAVQGLLLWMAAELPNSPFRPKTARDVRGSILPQFRIGNLMLWIAGLSVLFAALARLGVGLFALLTGFLALPVSVLLVFAVLDAPPRSPLLRPTRNSNRRTLLRLLAVFGLMVVYFFAISLFAGAFR